MKTDSQTITIKSAAGGIVEDYEIIERGNALPERDSVVEILLSKDGPCARQAEDDPLQRPCTPRFHYHRFQNETVTVLKGLMGYYLGSKNTVKIAKQGETVIFPQNVPHTFWSLSAKQDLLIRIKTSPAMNSAAFYENYIGIKRDQKNPILRPLNLLYTELESDIYPAEFSLWTGRFTLLLLQTLGKLTDMMPYYNEYTNLMPSGYAY